MRSKVADALCFMFFFFAASSAHAVTIQIQNMSGAEKDKISAFIFETLKTLPQTFSDKLPQTLTLKFELLDGKSDLSDACQKPHFLGASRIDSNQITLHQGFVSPLVQGQNIDLPRCRHRDLMTLARATLIHELAHFVDLKNPEAFGPRPKLAACQNARALKSPNSCADIEAHMGAISSTPRFLAIAGWRNRSAGYIEKANFFEERSPDRYEYKSPEEAFAVNAEYFFLDPEFACRRPAMAGLLADYFGVSKVMHPRCTAPHELPAIYPEMSSLKFENLKEVHLLLAGPGSDSSSRFGHTMLRLAFSSRESVAEHVVISPRAEVNTSKYSQWDGLTGAYVSKVYIETLPKVIQEYTREEFRDLESYPLRMSPRELRAFWDLLVESFWLYQGQYRFLSGNCVSDSLRLLQGTYADFPISDRVDGSYMTPKGLRNALSRAGVLDLQKGMSAPEKVRHGLFFYSRKTQLERALSEFQSQRKSPDEVLSLTSQERKTWETEELRASREPRKQVLSRIFLIEDIVSGYVQNQLKLKLMAEWPENEAGLPTSSLSTKISTDRFGYGVPLDESWAGVSVQDAVSASNPAVEKMRSILLQKHAEEYEEFKRSVELRQYWLKQLLSTN